MIYLLVKAGHIVALMTWIGGMLAQVLLLRTMAPGPHQRHVLDAAVRCDRRLVAPAMMLAWACGLALASIGHWFSSPWLIVKLVLVVALSAVHGVVSGSVRRMAGGAPASSALSRHAGTGILVSVTAIVLLVVIKP